MLYEIIWCSKTKILYAQGLSEAGKEVISETTIHRQGEMASDAGFENLRAILMVCPVCVPCVACARRAVRCHFRAARCHNKRRLLLSVSVLHCRAGRGHQP